MPAERLFLCIYTLIHLTRRPVVVSFSDVAAERVEWELEKIKSKNFQDKTTKRSARVYRRKKKKRDMVNTFFFFFPSKSWFLFQKKKKKKEFWRWSLKEPVCLFASGACVTVIRSKLLLFWLAFFFSWLVARFRPCPMLQHDGHYLYIYRLSNKWTKNTLAGRILSWNRPKNKNKKTTSDGSDNADECQSSWANIFH